MIKKLTAILEHPKRDVIYDILGFLKLDLCLDIGAAAGHETKRICLAGGVNTRVIAFEPFPGNHQYFQQTIESLENNIKLVKKAVSDGVGTSRFIVGSVVKGDEPGWQQYTGYSSVGFLTSVYGASFLKSALQKVLSKILKRPGKQILDVATTTIDTELPGEEINFIKIDVQGAEEKVLRGAATALKESRIHIMYIEWTGEQGILDILTNYGYHIYDSTYVVGSKTRDIQQFKDIGFNCIEEISLSTGKLAYDMILADNDTSPADAMRKVKSQKLGWIQTDLIAVSSAVNEQFLTAVKEYSKSRIDNKKD